MGDNFNSSNENINNVTRDKNSTSKGKRSRNIIKVALYMLKKSKTKSKKSKSSTDLTNATNATISRLVGSVRPFHQDGIVGGQSPPPPPPFSPKHSLSIDESSIGMSPSPLHSCHSYSSLSQASCSSPSIGCSSHFASFQSLYDLDVHGDEEISCATPCSDAYYDGIEGDCMIDSKADMFISSMYQRMRKQDTE